MKMEIEISDDEIRKAVFLRLVEALSDEIFGHYRTNKISTRELRAVLREVLAENKEQIVNDAVKYAGSYIGKKGVKRIIENL